MEQWLYLFLSMAALIGGWRVVRRCVERRFPSRDSRIHLTHREVAQARERQALDKNHYYEPGY